MPICVAPLLSDPLFTFGLLCSPMFLFFSFLYWFDSFPHLYKDHVKGESRIQNKSKLFLHKGCSTSHSHSGLSLSSYCSIILKMGHCNNEKHRTPQVENPLTGVMGGCLTLGPKSSAWFIMQDWLSLASILDVTFGRTDVRKGPEIKKSFWTRIILTGKWQKKFFFRCTCWNWLKCASV